MKESVKKIVVFTGAGVSADSGLSTFRDADGLWDKYRIEDVCTPEALARNRERSSSSITSGGASCSDAVRTQVTRPFADWKIISTWT